MITLYTFFPRRSPQKRFFVVAVVVVVMVASLSKQAFVIRWTHYTSCVRCLRRILPRLFQEQNSFCSRVYTLDSTSVYSFVCQAGGHLGLCCASGHQTEHTHCIASFPFWVIPLTRGGPSSKVCTLRGSSSSSHWGVITRKPRWSSSSRSRSHTLPLVHTSRSRCNRRRRRRSFACQPLVEEGS